MRRCASGGETMTQKKLDKLQMRAYQVIDEIENKGDQRAKYQYLEIMTTILFSILDSLLAIRTAFFFMAGLFLGMLLKLVFKF